MKEKNISHSPYLQYIMFYNGIISKDQHTAHFKFMVQIIEIIMMIQGLI